MKAWEFVAEADAERRVQFTLPVDMMSGPVRVLVLAPDTPQAETDDADSQWAAGVGEQWAADWADPREDIYTLQDGEPAHAEG